MAFTVNSFNVGQNLSVVFTDDQGDSFTADQLGHLTDFDANSDARLLTVYPVTNGGKPIRRRIPAGWSGRLMFTRYNGALIDMIAGLDNLFYTQGLTPYFTANCTILNADGSTDTYTFTQIQFSGEGFGNFRADKEVDQSLPFAAQELIIPANATTLLTNLLG